MKHMFALVVLGSAGLGGTAPAQETTPKQSFTPAEIAQAFATCRESLVAAQSNERRFPMPELRVAVPEQDAGQWLEGCVLETLQGNRAKLFPLS